MPAPVEGVPVCADFELGRSRMEGTLRHPVRMRVVEGKTQLFKQVIVGLRKAGDPTPRTLIVDDNGEYTVEWAQCANERAPRTVTEAAHATGKGRDREHGTETGYDCGEPAIYKTEKLVTRKGDRASHTINFAMPPDAACWVGDVPALHLAPPAVPAPIATAAPIAADAGAAPPASDAGVTDAGAR